MGPCRVLPWMPALFRASHVRLVSFAPALAPARCLVVPTINTVHQSFPFCFPGTTLSMGLQLFHPKSWVQCQGESGSASRRHPSPGSTRVLCMGRLPELLQYTKACCRANDAN